MRVYIVFKEDRETGHERIVGVFHDQIQAIKYERAASAISEKLSSLYSYNFEEHEVWDRAEEGL